MSLETLPIIINNHTSNPLTENKELTIYSFFNEDYEITLENPGIDELKEAEKINIYTFDSKANKKDYIDAILKYTNNKFDKVSKIENPMPSFAETHNPFKKKYYQSPISLLDIATIVTGALAIYKPAEFQAIFPITIFGIREFMALGMNYFKNQIKKNKNNKLEKSYKVTTNLASGKTEVNIIVPNETKEIEQEILKSKKLNPYLKLNANTINTDLREIYDYHYKK